jgi:quinol monooxygenase YgiN
MIRVLIERHCQVGKEHALGGLLKDLRAESLRAPGYVSGETLVRIDDTTSFLVVSTWIKLDCWKAWENSQARLEIVNMIEPLLSDESTVRIYSPPLEEE